MRIRSAIIAALVAVSTLAVDAAPLRLFPLVFGAATSDRVEITATSALNGLTTWTVVSLIQPTTMTGNRIIATKGGLTTSRISLFLQSAGGGDLQSFIQHATTSLNYRTTSVPLVVNQWRWVAAVCDLSLGTGLRVKFYSAPIGGAWRLETTGVNNEPAGGPSPDTANYIIGNITGATTPLQGYIAFSALSSKPLTLDEIDGIRRNWRSGIFRGALGAWVPGANGTGPVIDITGNGNHGALTGAKPTGQAPPTLAFRIR